MKCPNCGNDVFNTSTMCIRCGHPLTPVEEHPSPLQEYMRKDADRQLLIGFVGMVAGIPIMFFIPILGWMLIIAGGLAVITNLIKKYRK